MGLLFTTLVDDFDEAFDNNLEEGLGPPPSRSKRDRPGYLVSKTERDLALSGCRLPLTWALPPGCHH